MNRALVDRIVHAVLYEGYMLYPYRPSVKNRQRWTFGGICPESYCRVQPTGDASAMQTECLVRGDGQAEVDVTVRFLHLMDRTVREVERAVSGLPHDGEPASHPVASLQVGERQYQPWQEAVEREVNLGSRPLREMAGATGRVEIAFPRQRQVEFLHAPTGDLVGLLVREQQAIQGAIETTATVLAEGLFKLTVRIVNQTPLPEAERLSRDEAMTHALVSTHTILTVRGGDFVSLMNPPEDLRAATGDCKNVGAWPVLVGDEGTRDAMLSSPIILYDYPQVAPESPGDLFDATEIDEILTLRILTLTEDEKRQAAAVDERARALLERTESLAREQLLSLHGTVRGLQPVNDGGGQ